MLITFNILLFVYSRFFIRRLPTLCVRVKTGLLLSLSDKTTSAVTVYIHSCFSLVQQFILKHTGKNIDWVVKPVNCKW